MTTATKTASKPAAKAAQTAPSEQQPAEAPKPQHASLAAALAAFQGECPPIRKGNTAKVPTKSGGQYTYDYADLSDVIEVVEPVLSRHGLSFNGLPTVRENSFGLAYKLRHTSGEVDEGFYPLPDPLRTPQQEMGSALTYIRRYVLCAVVGVAPGGDDDDAQTAQQYAQRQQQRPPQQQRQQQPPQPVDAGNGPTLEQWVARAEAAATPNDLGMTWQEARAAGADNDVLDAIAAVGRRRQADAAAALEAQAAAAAAEGPQAPTDTVDAAEAAEAAAVAEHEASLAVGAQAEAVQA